MEQVGKEFSAEKAGIKPGDILLRWSRGEDHGNFDSPFCLTWVEMDQGSRGALAIEGLSGGTAKAWPLEPRRWGLQARPRFSTALSDEYEQLRQQAGTSALMDNQGWKKLADQLDMPSRAWLFLQRASFFSAQHHWEAANSAYGDALSAAGENPLSAWRVELSWGNDLLARGEYDGAQIHYSNAYAEAQKIQPDALALAFTLKNSGMAYWYKEDYKNAHKEFVAALALFERMAPRSMAVTDIYTFLGRIAQDEADFDNAERNYLQAASIQENLGQGNTIEAAWSSGSLATIYSTRGELEKAEKYFRKALAIEQRLEPGTANLAAVMMGIGHIAEERDEFQKAERYYLEALRILRANAPEASQRVALEFLAELNRNWGRLGTASRYLDQALAIQRKSGLTGPLASDIFREKGEVAYLQGHLDAAELNFKKALRIDEKIAPDNLYRAATLTSLGQLACRRGQLKECEHYYTEAAAIRGKIVPGSRNHAETLLGLGEVNRRFGRVAAALEFYGQAATALERQSATFGGSGETRATFRATYSAFYHDYTSLLIRQGQTEKAFQVFEQSRARTLLETLSLAKLDLRQGIAPDLLELDRTLQRAIQSKSELRIQLLNGNRSAERLKAIEQEIADLTSRYEDVKVQLRSASPNYAALTQPQPLTAREIQERLLDPSTILLEYSLGEKRGHVFVVTPDSVEVFDLPKRAEVEAEARRVYGLLAARNHGVRGETPAQREHRWRNADAEYLRAARELSSMVLGPVAGRTKGKRLVIVADGALQYIPFAALPEPGSDGKSPVPLAVNHEIVSLPSASVLAVLRQQYKDRKPAAQAVAVLADPVFDKDDPRVNGNPSMGKRPKPTHGQADKSAEDDLFSTSFSAGLLTRSADDLGLRRNGQLVLTRLRYTRQEANAIRATAPAGQVLEAVDFKASRATATSPELANYRIIHFATHGLLNSKHPELSGLVLSLVDQKGQPQDGFLTLQDIYNMNLSADLVVLSACETGLGKEISGEGLIGLTRGFMYAGATRVVASLWKVSDVATAQLMAEFYKGMEREGLAPAAALRAAQVKMWKQKRWSSPYYWAAFQIQGEWR